MVEAEEKMAALKKAYADIILNTAKESASRILLSERKALCFQQNLFLAKEEALQTLLRLKSIMDSKMNEAERASLGQVRRIQELEIQLSEAENTIQYLRTELKTVNDKLEKMKCNLTKPLDKENRMGHAISEDKYQRDKLSSDFVLDALYGSEQVSTSNIMNATLNQQTDDDCCFSFEGTPQAEPLQDLAAENSCASNQDLASIIMQSKEPELYKNACTQRIRAFGQNILKGKLSSGKTDDQFSNNDLVVCEKEGAEKPSLRDSPKVDKNAIQAKNPDELKETTKHCENRESGQALKFFRRLSPRKQRSGCRRMTPTTFGDSSQGMSAKHGKLRLLKCGNAIASQCVMGDDQSNTEDQFSLGMETVGNENVDRSTYTLGATDMDNAVHLAENVQSTGECDLLPEEEPVVSRPDPEVTGNSDVSVCNINLDGADVLLVNSDSKDGKIGESSAAPTQEPSNRFLKYTFRRKRKRDLSSSIKENVFPEKNTLKKTAEKRSAFPETPKPNLVMESSRDSRRLVQVARQLISLSAKRW